MHGVRKVLLQFKKSLFVLFDATAESVNCSLEKFRKTFLLFDLQKKLRQTHRKFTATFISDNLSITDIALKNQDLSIIGIAQNFIEIIDYRYRFSTERFIVPINVPSNFSWSVCAETLASAHFFRND